MLRNHRGEGGMQMITFDYEGEGGLADDYVIKIIRIFHKFSLMFSYFLSLMIKIFVGLQCTN